MAYRSTENETTGFSQNSLMLGHEVSTPLDPMYEMPVSFKKTPVKQWVWEVQERMEKAHSQVLKNTGLSMKRQKVCHDARASYESFESGEKAVFCRKSLLLGTGTL
ncbi:hypothetical protein DPMN_101965 [Dreissena polymorpha]|uniref:Uncharacterized protein n=1 Tax=Dreissena polymorpha TaxID=45954 RepID=A0A9D4LKD9_DREPO|nr:hypothetical protein DPMN_101965 [Dreissena polymorpha]